jgi:hypothetical protein
MLRVRYHNCHLDYGQYFPLNGYGFSRHCSMWQHAALTGSIELLIVLNDDTNKITKTVPIVHSFFTTIIVPYGLR